MNHTCVALLSCGSIILSGVSCLCHSLRCHSSTSSLVRPSFRYLAKQVRGTAGSQTPEDIAGRPPGGLVGIPVTF